METPLRYRGRTVTRDDLYFIRALVAAHPGASRRRLSELLCEAWDWRQPNGTPRAMVCRGLMLALHRAGHLVLPPVRRSPLNPLLSRSRPRAVEVDRTPLRAPLRELRPLVIRQVRRTKEEPLLNSLIDRHHYLGYSRPVGEQLKFLAWAGQRPVACFVFSSAPRHLGPRDRFIGWSPEARRRNIHLVAYNSRFLLLPWVEVPHLASHLLGRMARMLSGEWERLYGHPLYLLETFVEPRRHRGTCYLAANWVVVGRTTGRGKDDRQHRGPNRPVKDVLCYPLVNDFRQRLSRRT